MSVADLAKKLSTDPAVLRAVDAAGAELLRVNPKLAAAVAARDPAAVMKVYTALGQNDGIIPPSLAAKEKQMKLPLKGTNKPPKPAPPPPQLGGSFDTGTAAYPSLGGQSQITGAPMPPPETISAGTMSVDDFIGRLSEPAPVRTGPATMDELLQRIAEREPPRFPQGIYRAGDQPIAYGADVDTVGAFGPGTVTDVSPSMVDGVSGQADITVRGGERYTGQFGPGRRMKSPEGFDIDPSLPPPEVNPAGSAEITDLGWDPIDLPEGDGRQLDDLFAIDDAPSGVPEPAAQLGADGVDIADDLGVDPPANAQPGPTSQAPRRSAAYQLGQGAADAARFLLRNRRSRLGDAVSDGLLGLAAYQYFMGPDGTPVAIPQLQAAPEESPAPTPQEAADGPEQQLMEMLNAPAEQTASAPAAEENLERLDGAPGIEIPPISLAEAPNFSQRVEEMIGAPLPEEEVLPEPELGPELYGMERAEAIRQLREDVADGVISPELARQHELYGRIPDRQLERSIKYASDLRDRRELRKYAGMFYNPARPGGYRTAGNLAQAYALLGNPEAEAAFVREYLLGGPRGTVDAFERDRLQRQSETERFDKQLAAEQEGRLLASNTSLRTAAMAADAEVAKAQATAQASMAGSFAEVAAAERSLQQQAMQFQQQEQRLEREGRIREAQIARDARVHILSAIAAIRQNSENAALKREEIAAGRPDLDGAASAANMQKYGEEIRANAYDAQQKGMSESEALGYVLSQVRGAPRDLAASIVRQYYQ